MCVTDILLHSSDRVTPTNPLMSSLEYRQTLMTTPLYIHVRNKAKAELGNFKVYVHKFTRGILNLVNSDKLDNPEVVDFWKEFTSHQNGCEIGVLESSVSIRHRKNDSHDVAEDLTTDASTEFFASTAENHDTNEDIYKEKMES
ncbi:9297_t:CDS:2 [Funneliformis mosseae]|uniref:9297_t:CDS:1 n=1 Tax=Funneliformis mosseae TaxID=27381 RepID=A0A9N8W6T8_FUNMO|nr:9297_t:CDS:2 [Funneliformis mosseae]